MIGAEGTGFETAMRTLDHTRVTIAAQAVGVAHQVQRIVMARQLLAGVQSQL
jgi:alkylation response protein AidB-like acyl-CoA dehydrogenase